MCWKLNWNFCEDECSRDPCFSHSHTSCDNEAPLILFKMNIFVTCLMESWVSEVRYCKHEKFMWQKVWHFDVPRLDLLSWKPVSSEGVGGISLVKVNRWYLSISCFLGKDWQILPRLPGFCVLLKGRTFVSFLLAECKSEAATVNTYWWIVGIC
jgi:hypothetical protein